MLYSTKTNNKVYKNLENEDIYSGFDDIPAALDSRMLEQDEILQETLRTTAIGKRGVSRMGTGVNNDFIYLK